jgi:hypothetical protein
MFHVLGLLLSALPILAINTKTSEAQGANITVNNPQLWTSVDQNIKIHFTYQPQNPILDQPTKLMFVVQSLKTGNNLKNLVTNILVSHNSSGQFSNFRFSNITIPGGQFSVIYRFQDTGIYEIIARISGNGIATLAPFSVIVPLQPYPP